MTTLKIALQEACFMELEGIPSEEELSTDETLTFSPTFERKMKKLLRQANHPTRYRVVRAVACFLLAVFISGSIILAFSNETRAAFLSWIRTREENRFLYRFSGSENTEFPSYVLGRLPEGYEEMKRTQTVFFVSYIYRRTDGDELLNFTYHSMSDGTANAVSMLGKGEIVPESVTVNGMEGDFYQTPDTSESNYLIWFDRDENLVFDLSGFFDKEALLRIAENVRLEDP